MKPNDELLDFLDKLNDTKSLNQLRKLYGSDKVSGSFCVDFMVGLRSELQVITDMGYNEDMVRQRYQEHQTEILSLKNKWGSKDSTRKELLGARNADAMALDWET